MTGPAIPLSALEPDADNREHARRVYARHTSPAAIDQALAMYAPTYGELLADALDAILAAVAVRNLAAHARAAQARRAELAPAATGDPALRSRVPGAAWAAWRRSTVTPDAAGRDR